MYFANENIEDFDRFIEVLGFETSANIEEASFVFLNLENFLFSNFKQNKINFKNHNLNARELNDRFNKLLSQFSSFEKNHPGQKQFRLLSIDLIDVHSYNDDDLFRWSYYNHKYASSQGQDLDALNEWHQLEQNLDIDRIAQFKARREQNLAHYMHVIKNHKFFDLIIFGGIDPKIKNETKYGLDIAEEQYIEKLINETRAERVCKIAPYKLSNINLNLIKTLMKARDIKLKASIVSNSKKLNPYVLNHTRNLLAYLDILESSFENSDFVILINDLDLLNSIPVVDTDKPIFAADLSEANTPNFGYLLLKDEGFSQIFSFAKKRSGEAFIKTVIRSLCSGLMYFVIGRKLNEQIALYYMDDYFTPLANSLGKNIKEFKGPIDLLTNKLENDDE